MLAQFCAILLFLWTPVSARILALVLQLYERNKLKLRTFCLHSATTRSLRVNGSLSFNVSSQFTVYFVRCMPSVLYAFSVFFARKVTSAVMLLVGRQEGPLNLCSSSLFYATMASLLLDLG